MPAETVVADHVEALAFHLAGMAPARMPAPAADAERWAAAHWPRFRDMAIDATVAILAESQTRAEP